MKNLGFERIDLSSFSTFRAELMGIAVIMIMASHTLGGYAAYGIVGVEWFLLLSAIGQYYSLKKNSETYSFYKRKILRILPAYLIVAIPYFLFKYPSSFRGFVIRISGLNFPIWGEMAFWFVSLIVICYLITPFYYRIILKHRYTYWVPFALAFITFILSYHLPRTEILFTRIPCYLLGLNFAQAVYDGNAITDTKRIKVVLLISILAVLALLTIYVDFFSIGLIRLIYFYCSIPSLLFVLLIIKKITFMNGVLAFVGSISYEVYLLHPKIVLEFCLHLPIPKALSIILSYIIAVLLAYVLHLVIKQVLMPLFNGSYRK